MSNLNVGESNTDILVSLIKIRTIFILLKTDYLKSSVLIIILNEIFLIKSSHYTDILLYSSHNIDFLVKYF